ncbi:MAG: hypothetical protein A2381_18575 [Bdellovibrionales bacterium RIFOXYB1_FULL_37_110]|nr:MAG: hypothetical protein A2417_01195 [Bdellovibrionales bacterium RIFOXYC1_FULL_37_79]OFZ59035.1 MAG: hypothetical protein A2381_18575 [Bdellovibrionales bacterium RIFOXYB1_FULL_37_110]OFZ65140.1 MAG: hypothetical protein A2577_04890 [Bdellovibrionales bacterium RIFOXYD1_FULL_36_51]
MHNKVQTGNNVTIECVGQLENGMVFLDTKEDEPIVFEVGNYSVIKGLNKAVIGMILNEEKKITLSPEDAFGEYNDTLILNVPLNQLPAEVSKGMQLKSQDDKGEEIIWSIKEVQKKNALAVLDGNHILAGHTLSFNIKLIKIT